MNPLALSNLFGGINAYTFAIQCISGANTTNSVPYPYYVDSPPTSTVVTANIAGVTLGGFTPINVSGVPRLVAGTPFSIISNIAQFASEFYNNIKVASISGAGCVTTNYAATNGDIAALGPFGAGLITNSPPIGVPLPVTINTTISTPPVFISPIVINATAFNSRGIVSAPTLVGSLIGTFVVDTLSISLIETNLRVNSGTGQYPTNATNIGTTFNSNTLLTAVNNEELQFIGGAMVYPPLVNYAGFVPGTGPDYTGIAGGAFAGYRWLTQNIPLAALAVNPISNATITLSHEALSYGDFLADYFQKSKPQ